MKPKSPCIKECPSRAPDCRSTCSRYLEYEKQRMAMYEHKWEEVSKILAGSSRWSYQRRASFYRNRR